MKALVVAIALAAAASTAMADEADERKARAARLVDEASAAEKRADYATAIDRLRAAYDLIPHPALLYNLGQAYRLSDQPWDALDQYERYLAIEPKGRFASKARGYVTALKKATRGKTRPAEPRPTPREPDPRRPVGPPPIPPEPLDGGPGKRDPVTMDDEAPAGGGWKRPVAFGLGGAGLVGVGLGVYFGLQARSISGELSDHSGPWTDELLAKQAEGQTAEDRALWLTAAGGALVVGGVVLYALDARSRGGRREVALVPVLGAASIGIAVHGAL